MEIKSCWFYKLKYLYVFVYGIQEDEKEKKITNAKGDKGKFI